MLVMAKILVKSLETLHRFTKKWYLSSSLPSPYLQMLIFAQELRRDCRLRNAIIFRRAVAKRDFSLLPVAWQMSKTDFSSART